MLDAQDLIAAAVKLWGPPTSKKANEWRFGTHGSKSINLIDLLWYDHEDGSGGGILELCQKAGIKPNGHDKDEGSWTLYDYRDEKNDLLFQVVRKPGHKFLQRRPDGHGDWIWKLEGVRRVPYRLHELINREGTVFVCEGEKDVDNVRALGLIATTNPGGAGKWRSEYSTYLAARDVVILHDNDDAGRKHAVDVELSVRSLANSVFIMSLPGLGDGEDVSDWIARGGTKEKLEELSKQTKTSAPKPELPEAVRLDDFLYCSPENKYIFRPTGTLWPAPAVDKRLPWIGGTKPSTIIARTNPVEDMTWLPGEPELIKNKLIAKGGVIERPNATLFNLYSGPNFVRGDAHKADVWCDHIRYVYPDEADHIIKWFAHRCQHPDIKIEHALVLGGTFGIGKDTLLAPLYRAVGPRNVESVSPTQMLERFNGHLKSILLVINEARDLGDVNRPQFYERLKLIISSPHPLLIDEKNTHPYYIPNVVGVVYTTNHKVGGMYLAPDDRRHMVAWSPREMDDFEPSYTEYFNIIWQAYEDGGLDAIATYLHELDLSDFNPKAPPPKTEAFYEVVMASQSPDASELGDILNKFGNPKIVTLADLQDMSVVDERTVDWLRDRHNLRMWPRWFEQQGYIIVRNLDAKDGRWQVSGRKHVIFGRKEETFKELQTLARMKSRGLGV